MKDTELYAQLLGLKDGWHVSCVELNMDKQRIDVWVQTTDGGRWSCSVCKSECSIYDHTKEQTWRHLDTCQCQTFVHARLPRTQCKDHGVRQVAAPWAGPRSRFTLLMETRLVDTLKECDVTGCCRLQGTSWDQAWLVMEKAVRRGRERKPHRVPEYIGVDEKSFAKRHVYETLVCDIKEGTIEYVADDRKQDSLESYFRQFEEEELEEVKAIAMDMWDPYIAATKAHIPKAEEKIVFDRYHVAQLVSKAVDKVRRQEHKELKKKGNESLAGTRYLWLANEENVPEWRQPEFDEIRKADLKTGRAWTIKESLRRLWSYRYAGWAKRFFKRWYFWATHSRLEPMIKVARSLKSHLPNILTYFKNRITNASSEGINSKVQLIKQMACGFRSRKNYRTAIYFHCGGLDLYPSPEGA